MLARFFIDRPVLAWVISIVIVLLGAIAAGFLPVAEYPEIQPRTVRVTASYPGANAQVVADTVAAPIEQQVVGVEGMLYMSSQSNNDGSYTLDVTFALGTDVNMAQVLVQNRVAIAEPTLPDVVRAIGVVTKKRSPDILLGISLYSEDDPETGRPYYDPLYLSNYATINVKDAIARVEGVGDVLILGQQDYSMRVWLDPDKLQSRNLTVNDVIRVLREQNVQVAAGRIASRRSPGDRTSSTPSAPSAGWSSPNSSTTSCSTPVRMARLPTSGTSAGPSSGPAARTRFPGSTAGRRRALSCSS